MPNLNVLPALPPAAAALVGCSAAGALVAEPAEGVGPQAANPKLSMISKPSDLSQLFIKPPFIYPTGSLLGGCFLSGGAKNNRWSVKSYSDKSSSSSAIWAPWRL